MCFGIHCKSEVLRVKGIVGTHHALFPKAGLRWPLPLSPAPFLVCLGDLRERLEGGSGGNARGLFLSVLSKKNEAGILYVPPFLMDLLASENKLG